MDQENSSTDPSGKSSESSQPVEHTASSARSSVKETKIVSGGDTPTRGEVSASTIGLMLGLASSSELKLLEGRIDLVSAKLSTMTAKMDKIVAAVQNAPTGSDLERIDVQLSSIKTMVRDALMGIPGAKPDTSKSDSEATARGVAKLISNARAAEETK